MLLTNENTISINSNRKGYPEVSGKPLVGEGDLFPIPNPICPFSEPFRGTAGNLVGPDHPIFDPNVSSDADARRPIFPDIPGLPQPRYDPITPFVEDDPFNPSFDPFAIRGRGVRGRGRGARIPRTSLGEPNPDHFQPPSFGGNGGFI
jgi:hypothetical protein